MKPRPTQHTARELRALIARSTPAPRRHRGDWPLRLAFAFSALAALVLVLTILRAH